MTQSLKQLAIEVIESLPEDASLDDVMERLYFIAKVQRGLTQIEEGRVVPHEQVKRRFGRG